VCDRLFSFLIQLAELYTAFQKTKGKLDGANGVAEYLNVSRGGVYVRTRFIGLQPDEFRKGEATLDELLSTASVTGKILNDVRDTAKKYRISIDLPKIRDPK
jgi:hypothetical protein